MYEGFRANKFVATGEIQWMLNNAWPSMIWHLYDYYLRPGAAYFATKLACEPLHLLYRYDNQAIVVANDSLQSWRDLTASAQIYDIDGKLKHQQEAHCSAPANTATTAFTLPQLENISKTYFLRLALTDASQNVLSVNSYWLSTTPDVLDFSKSDWNITPCTSYADYTLLEKLPAVKLEVSDNFDSSGSGNEGIAKATVNNTSSSIALLVRLKIVNPKNNEQELLPIRWSDNYFMLLPGEQREISARYLRSDLSWSNPTVTVDCYNNARS